MSAAIPPGALGYGKVVAERILKGEPRRVIGKSKLTAIIALAFEAGRTSRG